MARECGWSKDFIADNLTIDQIRRYCEIIQEQKLKELQLNTIAISKATAYAFGSIKKKGFIEFLNLLHKEDRDIESILEDMKKAGLPIEEK